MERRALARAALALSIAGAGTWVRARDLDASTLWVDEAESSLDAASILERGLPVGRQLGLPVFQNTLLPPGRDGPEYEFHDPSFDRRLVADGIGLYHGWLPLYAIAGSLALCGIEPDPVLDPPRVLHGAAEMERRSGAPRLQAVVFAALFLVLVWRLGAALGGEGAGLAVLVVAAFAHRFVWFGQQARYYSATLAMTAAAALALVHAARSGRWRDHLLLALAAILLFHTHSMSFLVVGLAGAQWLPALVQRPGGSRRLATTLTLIAAGTLPWAIATGFFDVASALPRAWPGLDLPRDLFLLQRQDRLEQAALALVLLAVALAFLGPRRLPLLARARGELDRAAPALLWSGAWLVLAALAFPVLIPAPSYAEPRAELLFVLPALLFAATGAAAWLRALHPRLATPLLLALAIGYVATTGPTEEGSDVIAARRAERTQSFAQVLEQLARAEFEHGTRFFATPNDHLTLAWYSGLPVQTVAPLRRSFFEQPPCDVFLLELTARYQPLRAATVREEATALGVDLLESVAERIGEELGAWNVAAGLAARGARVAGAVGPDPQLAPSLGAGLLERLFARQRELTREVATRTFDRIAMLRGFPAEDWLAFWPIYSYRLVGPLERMGARQNFEPIVPRSTALVLPSSFTVIACTRDGRDPFASEPGAPRRSRGSP